MPQNEHDPPPKKKGRFIVKPIHYLVRSGSKIDKFDTHSNRKVPTQHIF